jgi:hypothetical protein
MFIQLTPSTSSSKLERWLGREECERQSLMTRDWYGAPVKSLFVPGDVKVAKGGGFVGKIEGGSEASLEQWIWDQERKTRKPHRGPGRKQHGGFADLAAVTNAERQEIVFSKALISAVAAGASTSAWRIGGLPVAGAAAAALPGGTVPTSASTGALPFTNADATHTMHAVGGYAHCDRVNTTFILYDRLWAGAVNMNSAVAQAVTGVPTRFQNTTLNTVDSAENNFLFFETGTVLAATAHNWASCTYTDQGNTAGVTLPTLAGISACAANRLDMPVMQFFAPLAAGDSGIKAITNLQLSAAVATGTMDAVLGHLHAYIPTNAINWAHAINGINSGFWMSRVFDNACLAILAFNPVATTQTYLEFPLLDA